MLCRSSSCTLQQQQVHMLNSMFIFRKPCGSCYSMSAPCLPTTTTACHQEEITYAGQTGKEHKPYKLPNEHGVMQCAAATMVWEANYRQCSQLLLLPCQEYAAPTGPIFSNLLAYALAGPQKCYGSTEKQLQLEHCSKDVAPAVLLPNSSSSLIYLEKQQGMF